MIGYIKGYDICNVTKRKIEKEKFLSEIQIKDYKIQEKIKVALENNGCIYGLKKKGILKAIYIFDNEKADNEKVLKFNESLYLEEAEDKKEQFEKAIIEDLKEKVTMKEFSKVDWGDIEIEPNKGAGFSGLTFSICISLGIIYGMLFDNLALGISFGVAIGLCFGAVVKIKK